jgi:hypothetical protein
MKKMLPFLLLMFIVALVSCNTNNDPKPAAQAVNYTDTAGLAQFQAWKAMHELQPASAYPAGVATATPPVQKKIVYYVPRSSRSVSRRSSYSGSSMMSSSSNTAYRPAKRGWSKAAVGTAVGAGSGAVIGALLDKRSHIAGGIIGGLLGGGAGYLVGHSIDKKNGRY